MNRKQREGAEIDDSFGSLSTFAADKVWSESVRRHNDSADVFHISQFDTVVLGSETSPEFDIFRMTLSSPWMLANALRAISAGWVFQLNADVTGKVCRASVDLLAFGVNSIPCQNNVLCIALIPQATESEVTYTLTYDDLRHGVATLCKVEPCRDENCDFCSTLAELLANDNVKAFVHGEVYRAEKLPVHTAMCDNFAGWVSFCRNVLGMDPNVCKPHGTGNASYIPHALCKLTFHSGRDRCFSVYPHQAFSECGGLS